MAMLLSGIKTVGVILLSLVGRCPDSVAVGPLGDALLKEDADYLLLETGDYLLLE